MPLSKDPAERMEETALRLLAKNALAALRGPVSRGAIPAALLARETGLARGTIRRMLDRELKEWPGEKTPFDLVATRCLDLRSSGAPSRWETTAARLAEKLADRSFATSALEAIGETLQEFDQHGADTGLAESDAPLVVGYILRACLLAIPNEDLEADPFASKLRDLCLSSTSESTKYYADALRLLLKARGRRPIASLDEERIVALLHSLFDGYMQRHLLDPELHPLSVMLTGLWHLLEGLTEPSAFSAPDGDEARVHIAHAALEIIKVTEKVPSPIEAAQSLDYPKELVENLFPTRTALAEECLRLALDSPSLREVSAFSQSLVHRTEVMATLTTMLSGVSDAVATYKRLMPLVSTSATWDELERLIADVVQQGFDVSPDFDVRGTAKMLLRESRSGREGDDRWRVALETLALAMPSATE